MPIDPYAITTVLAGAAAAWAMAHASGRARNARFWQDMHHDADTTARRYRAEVLDYQNTEQDAKRRRTEQARKAGIAGGAKRKAKTEAEAPARREQTITELSATKFRSRAQVVASVKAARTRKQNSDAGAAAMKGG